MTGPYYMLLLSIAKGDRPMDVRTRILTARLAVRVDENKTYSQKIGVRNTSDYRKNKERKEGR